MIYSKLLPSITQNIDNLHERAGSRNIIHLHGELTKVCSEKNKNLICQTTEDIQIGDKAEDGAQLRPFIVWFGEEVPMMEKAMEITQTADIFFDTYMAFMQERQNVRVVSSQKIDANNKLFDAISKMLNDGQLIYRQNYVLRKHFTFIKLLQLIRTSLPPLLLTPILLASTTIAASTKMLPHIQHHLPCPMLRWCQEGGG